MINRKDMPRVEGICPSCGAVRWFSDRYRKTSQEKKGAVCGKCASARKWDRPTLDENYKRKVLDLHASGMSERNVATTLSLGLNTVQRVLKELGRIRVRTPLPEIKDSEGRTILKCSICQQMLPCSEFSISRSRGIRGRSGSCRPCTRVYLKNNRHKYLPNKRKQSTVARRALRKRVLQHYSGSTDPYCACCKETLEEFLSIDHINGGGSQHKKQVRHVYKWLERNNFPAGFRVLCHNCNQARGAYGYCPHEKVLHAA